MFVVPELTSQGRACRCFVLVTVISCVCALKPGTAEAWTAAAPVAEAQEDSRKCVDCVDVFLQVPSSGSDQHCCPNLRSLAESMSL